MTNTLLKRPSDIRDYSQFENNQRITTVRRDQVNQVNTRSVLIHTSQTVQFAQAYYNTYTGLCNRPDIKVKGYQ